MRIITLKFPHFLETGSGMLGCTGIQPGRNLEADHWAQINWGLICC